MTSQDYYEVLQVHPRVDDDAIVAAYERLCGRYDPAKLVGVAEELVQLARQKREQIDQAYAVLSDPLRRKAYDEQMLFRSEDAVPKKAPSVPPSTTAETEWDYRPLPPANRTERSREFNAQPIHTPSGRTVPQKVPHWAVPVGIVAVIFSIVGVSLLFTGEAGLRASLGAPPLVPTLSPLDMLEEQVQQARAMALQNPDDVEVLLAYGDLLYDSIEIIRENAPDSGVYQERLPRWLEVTEVYSQVLALEPDNHRVRATLGESACFYGAGTGDREFIESGIAEARLAVERDSQNVRSLWSLTQCLLSDQPPKTAEALTYLQQITQLAPNDSPFAIQAQQLILQYEKE
ncbi:MAG: molecular chaperone DnaJ [Chloroflexi bacterium AL-W]|nr:molecular chaperone DnaJ [Chloroflexi bacterium AL-N1]NOK65775.1 molecular chaperone DnaJ [Chloroflexi bacterium AL-N10]NOK74284.1 molecular chaperone DnaJ [Chloroflexi bacterium AL-N5]NOK80808.1 molecular chaperone DnaJ [Chloroflexi bacterium AL-W]NOK88542.1 molecular chaperone DnaJ [Chloroflexi bacterium AL-N15]